MTLTEDDIREFVALWQDEFGEVISSEVARSRASQIIEIYLHLYGPEEGDSGGSASPSQHP
jgi:hypothetical protein